MSTIPPLQDEDVIKMLAQLKDAGPVYPADALENRRRIFRKAAGGIILGIPLVFLVKAYFEHWTWQTVLKAVVISVLAVETVAGVYVYREQIRDWWFSTPTPSISLPILTVEPTARATATPSITPTGTTTEVFIIESTPKARPTDSGNHFGQTQTPKP